MEQVQIVPNRLAIATQELSNLNLGEFKIPTEIPKNEETYYHVIGIKSRDSRDGMSKVHAARVVAYNYVSWEKMQQQIKVKLFKNIANDHFTKVVILHNPTIKEEKPKMGRPPAIKKD